MIHKLLLGAAIVVIGVVLARAQVNAPPGPPTICTSTAIYDGASNGSTELVAARTGAKIYVCGFIIRGGGTLFAQLVYGTGTNCITGRTALTPQFVLAINTGVEDSSTFNRGMITTDSQALCFNSVGAVSAQGIVYYGQYLTN